MEWIKVEDQLPETNFEKSKGYNPGITGVRQVIAYYKLFGGWNIAPALVTQQKENEVKWHVDLGKTRYGIEADEVTHWMPLPDKPEDEDSNSA